MQAKKIYLTLVLNFLLLGYFTLGKGFAYLHIPGTSIFVGELFLLSGLLILLFQLNASILRHVISILTFCAWGFLITYQSFESYYIEALRDSAMYYYSFFTVIVFTLLYNKDAYEWLWSYLLFAFKFILIFHFTLKVFGLFGLQLDFVVPGAEDISLYWIKFGDLCILLSGALILLLAASKKSKSLMDYMYFLIAGILILLTIPMNRGGLLSFAVGIFVYLAFQPLARKVKFGCLIFVIALFVFFLLPAHRLDRETAVGSLNREQITSMVISIFDPITGNYSSSYGTINWRLMFWSDLIHSTINKDEYLIFGQGLGPNFEVEYGYLTGRERPNKHPHNFTVNIFSRMGIIALFLWLTINISYFLRLKKAIRISDGTIRNLLVFFMAIWSAMLINSSFDVYLEGPMGAIPFWSFMGIGLWLTKIAHDQTANKSKEVAKSFA